MVELLQDWTVEAPLPYILLQRCSVDGTGVFLATQLELSPQK